MSAIHTSLADLYEGSSLASRLPPIAGLLLQALTMGDVRVTHTSSDKVLMSVSSGSEAIQRGVEFVKYTLARIAKIIVGLADKRSQSEGDLPTSLRSILDSLRRFALHSLSYPLALAI